MLLRGDFHYTIKMLSEVKNKGLKCFFPLEEFNKFPTKKKSFWIFAELTILYKISPLGPL